LQLGIERMDRLLAGSAVTHPADPDLPEQGQHRASVKPLVGEPDGPLVAADHDRLTDVAVAAPIDVRLQLEARDLPAPLL
jgi:hypothetical protein